MRGWIIGLATAAFLAVVIFWIIAPLWSTPATIALSVFGGIVALAFGRAADG